MGPKCKLCDRVHCQLSGMPHDARTPQVHPGFEDIKPVDFMETLTWMNLKVVKEVKKSKGKATKGKKPKVYTQGTVPPAPKGSLIGGGDVRLTATEKAAGVKAAGGDPSKIFTGGALPQGGPLAPYEPMAGGDA